MPEFSPGESRTAIVTMSNPTAKAFDYVAELYMGTDLAIMAQTPFHLETEESKDISLPVIMPSNAGTYPVYIGVFSDSQFIEPLYQAEDVVITAPPPPLSMSITKISTATDKYATAWWVMELSCQISNPHSVPISHELHCIWAFGSSDPNLLASFKWSRYWRNSWPSTGLLVTLNPGQSVTLISPFYYIDGWHDMHMNYEWSNMPPGAYKAGVRKKYWFRIIDELGNWSPVKSVGTA